MEINIVRYIFIFNAVVVGGWGLLINYMGPYLPVLLIRPYCYGKYSLKVHSVLAMKCEVPKRWFKHFYMFAAPASTVTLCLIFYRYFYNGKMPEIILTLLDTLFGTSRKPLIPAENVIMAIILYNIQCWKRLYETTCVSIFSDQKIHVMLYIIGYVHYLGALLCLIGESEGFVRDSQIDRPWDPLTVTACIYAFIFIWSTYMQLDTNFVLAKLRKNKDGVVSHNYSVPFNGLFKYISNPLQFTEILMYIMLSLIMWPASTHHYVTFWVIANQAECAYLSHQWYRNTFKDYPKNRKILIPFVW